MMSLTKQNLIKTLTRRFKNIKLCSANKIVLKVNKAINGLFFLPFSHFYTRRVAQEWERERENAFSSRSPCNRQVRDRNFSPSEVYQHNVVGSLRYPLYWWIFRPNLIFRQINLLVRRLLHAKNVNTDNKIAYIREPSTSL